MTLAAIGVVAGLAGAFGLTRVMASLLFNVQPDDPDDVSRDFVSAYRRRVSRLLFAGASRGETRPDDCSLAHVMKQLLREVRVLFP